MSSTARRRAGGSQARGDSGTAGDDACAGQGNDGGASAVRNTSAHGAAPTSSPSAGDGEFVGDESLWLSQPLKALILVLICVVAFTIRLFAVVRWESVIHEYDPYFNFRTTKFLSNEGFYAFLNWFDDRGWYPLGRIIGGTIYPGLMVTAAAIHGVLNALNISINVRNMCVFLAPVFAANTALATYLLVKEVMRRTSTALLAAALVAVVPSYISRSTAGSYDNEGVAIFALLFTFYLWVKSVNTGSLAWGAACALSYFYMVAAWGGYVFIINIIPIYVVVMVVAGRYSARLYVAYSTFYTIGSLLAMQVPFVGFNVVAQAECAASHGVFVLLQGVAAVQWFRTLVSSAAWKRLVFGVVALLVCGVAGQLFLLQVFGYTRWTGRSLSLLDPTYAKKFVPIISSVSEHQPTSWTSFFFDLHICVPFAPVGLFFLFRRITDARIFLIIYGTISWYFAGVMVRLMLTLAPAACMLAAIGISGLINRFAGHMRASIADEFAVAAEAAIDRTTAADGDNQPAVPRKPRDAAAARRPFPFALAMAVVIGITLLLMYFTMHATFVSSQAYSSPSIVLATTRHDGSRVILDDFREAYYWLRMNTAADAKVMSWWDYGYQLASMSNRTTLADGNTYNNSHIATIGRAMSSPESRAYPILQSLDVDYVLAIFGGMTGYQSDDIAKFLWMVRIGSGVYPDEIQEGDYFSDDGDYTMGPNGSPAMLNCLMYKMCYYRFDEMPIEAGRPSGFDRARQTEIGHKGIKLETLEEAFTSEHWLVRIYKVKKPANRVSTAAAVARREVRARELSLNRKKTKHSRRAKGNKASARSSAPSKSKAKRGSSRLSSRRASSDRDKTARGARAAEQPPAANVPNARYVGCYTNEEAFGRLRVYAGGRAGASFGLARYHAESKGKRFFAIARDADPAYGHAFAFDKPLSRPDSNSKGCRRPCVDDKKKACGCADEYCGESAMPGRLNRQWAVYEVVGVNHGSEGVTSAGPPPEKREKRKSRKSKKSKKKAKKRRR